MATTLTEKAGCCRKGFQDHAPRQEVQTQKPEVPEHLICPCYRPKKNSM